MGSCESYIDKTVMEMQAQQLSPHLCLLFHRVCYNTLHYWKHISTAAGIVGWIQFVRNRNFWATYYYTINNANNNTIACFIVTIVSLLDVLSNLQGGDKGG